MHRTHFNGIMFHHFHGEGHSKSQGSISASQFKQMIMDVGLHRIVAPQQLLDRAKSKKYQNPKECSDIVITFDDGLLSQYEVALPVLDELKLKAFWFVNSGPPSGLVSESLEVYRHFRMNYFDSINIFYKKFEECAIEVYGASILESLRHFNPKDYLISASFYTDEDRTFRFLRDIVLGAERYHACMKKMFLLYGFNTENMVDRLWIRDSQLLDLSKADHAIGLHSHTHPTRIEGLSLGHQIEEYELNYQHIYATTGAYPRSISHPCGSYSVEGLKVLNDLGLVLGFRANCENLNSEYSWLELPRIDHADLVRKMSFQ